jgi:hypothetical protein
MNRRTRFIPWIFCAAAIIGLACPHLATAQTRSAEPKPSAAAAPALTDQDAAAIQDQLIQLLRTSPVLTSVVARDPSLLSDQAYVTRNNPELAQFLVSHPDVARSPEFYLFSHLADEGGNHRDQALERAVWPDLVPIDRDARSGAAQVVDNLIPMIVVPVIFGAFVWIFYIVFQSIRWNRTFKQQSEIHARLIDKFSSSQDLAAYMETEAGKQFLSTSAFASGPQAAPRMPNAVARVLTPLQIGIVMTLLGIGLILLRHAGPDMETPMAVLGTLVLAPGIGFILSAGVTWVVAQRLGLLPEKEDVRDAAAFGSQGRQ